MKKKIPNYNYIQKFSKLIRNPRRVTEIPSFIVKELTLWRGTTSKSVRGISVTFIVDSPVEYSRINNFMETKDINERDIIRRVLEEVKEEDVFYDIGANIGTHGCFAGKVGETVYGFEPFPENARSLRKNFEANGIKGQVFELALMNENSTMMLTKESGEAGEGKNRISDKGEIEVEAVRGDDLIEREKIEEPNVMKIDVEGAELEVLKGLKKTLSSKELRAIFVEIHPDKLKDFNGSEKEVRNLLKESGFEVNNLKRRGNETHIKANKINRN